MIDETKPRRGRPTNATPHVEWWITIPVDLALKVELRLMDPTKGRAIYGSRSKLIQALLYEWTQGQVEQK